MSEKLTITITGITYKGCQVSKKSEERQTLKFLKPKIDRVRFQIGNVVVE